MVYYFIRNLILSSNILSFGIVTRSYGTMLEFHLKIYFHSLIFMLLLNWIKKMLVQHSQMLVILSDFV